jgi:enamine deaminase RidA (YjgF/YER057c/UK114 family)
LPRQLIASDRLTKAVPYHYAAAAAGEAVVFSAGACPLDSDGRVIHTGDIAGQTRQSLANLKVALEDSGCSHAGVVKTTIFVASSSREDLLLAWDEYTRVFGTDGPPSTLLGVAVLGWPEQLVEIEAVAVRDRPPDGSGHLRA